MASNDIYRVKTHRMPQQVDLAIQKPLVSKRMKQNQSSIEKFDREATRVQSASKSDLSSKRLGTTKSGSILSS